MGLHKAAEQMRATHQDGISISKVDVVVHPGDADEETVKVFRAPGYEEA